MKSIRKLFIPIIILAVSVLLNGCDAQALDTYVSNENAPVSTSNSEFDDNKDELPVRKEPDSKEAVYTGDTPPG